MVKYDCDVIPFKNRPIKLMQEPDTKVIWICLYDLCCALKRPMLVKTGEAQAMCSSCTRIVFKKDAPHGLWAIHRRDVYRLTTFLKGESSTIAKLCEELIAWCDKLPEELGWIHAESSGYTEEELLLKYNNSKNKSAIQLFNDDRFGEIRVITNNNNDPIFCLTDICFALGIKDTSRCASRLDDDMRLTHPIKDKLNRTQNATFVTEGGLYDVVIRSDSEKAKPFRRWITNEVLPSIRKTGGYIPTNPGDSDAEVMARALMIAQNTLNAKDKLIESQKAKIEEDKHKVDFYDDFIENRDWFKTTTIADELKITPFVLHKFLIDNGICKYESREYVVCNSYTPLQCDVPYYYTNKKGKSYPCNKKKRWTKYGREYILELWKSKHEIKAKSAS